MPRLSSEAAFLECIDRHFANTHPHMERGRGDDCAVLACPGRLSVSSDLFLEDVHFRRSYFSPADIGYKALAVNLSDIAAMGGVPLGFSLALMVPAFPAEELEEDAEGIMQPAPAGCSLPVVTAGTEAYWDAFFGGMAELANQYDVALTGGDLSRAPIMGVSIAIWGEQVMDGDISVPFLARGEAAAGDLIFIVGDFGLARIGLLALENMGRSAETLYPRAVRAHLRPVPHVLDGQAVARFAAENGAGNGGDGGRIRMMDLSDGLARDLPRLLGTEAGSGLCADLTIEASSLHEEVGAYCLANDLDPLEQATLGGEDYALVGTCPPHLADALGALLPHMRILGRVAAAKGHALNGMPWEACGFDHFA